MSTPAFSEIALAYADRHGIPVFPLYGIRKNSILADCECRNPKCGSPGKHPRTSRGLYDATTSAEQLRDWGAKWPTANVGVPTGDQFVVVDVDGPDGYNSVNTLRDGRPWPLGPYVLTGKGEHRYFAPSNVGNRAAVVSGVDIRGKRGYVVAPPSLHVSGRQYRWAENGHIRLPLPDLPDWISLALAPREPQCQAAAPIRPSGDLSAYGTKALNDECRRVAAAPKGAWNHTLNRAAFSLGQLVGAGILPLDLVAGELHAASSARGHATTEAEKTIASGLNKGLHQPRAVAS